MIKFFRKIRQKLLSENKLSKYLIYAIGEIVLVVIGILIALSINTWNEKRKLKTIETEILIEIKQDLEQTSKELKADLDMHTLGLNASNELIQFLKFSRKSDKPIGYLLSISCIDAQAYPKTSGFNLLQSKGISTISNDQLRKNISDLYQLSIKRVIELGKLNPYNDIYKVIKPYENKHFISTNSPYRSEYVESLNDSIHYYKYEPISIDNLIADNAFQIDLENVITIRLDKIRKHKDAINRIQSILDEINNELNK